MPKVAAALTLAPHISVAQGEWGTFTVGTSTIKVSYNMAPSK